MANPRNLSPSEVAHVWAQGVEREGSARPSGAGMHGSGGHRSAYFEGPVLYSYGSHFVSAVRVRSPREGNALAFVTAERNSKTTNERVGEAWHAVSHYPNRYRLPTIPRDLAETLAGLARGEKTFRAYDAEAQCYVDKPYRERVAPFIRDNAADFASQGSADAWAPRAGRDDALALGALVGLSAAAVDRLIRAGVNAAADREAAERKRELQTKLTEARRVADMSADEWAEYRNGRGDGGPHSWEAQEAQRRVKRVRAAYLAASKAAKVGRFSKAKLAKAKARLADLKEWADGMTARNAETLRAKFEREAREWLALPDASAAPGRDDTDKALWFTGANSLAPQASGLSWAPDLAAEVAAAAAARAAEWHEARFAEWQADILNRDLRPSPNDYAEGSAARAAILADQAEERATAAAMYEAWEADPTQPRPSARLFLRGELESRFGIRAYNRLAAAEREEKEREAWRKWRDGESAQTAAPRRAMPDGSAYVRRSRDGERLETSQGASVPWDHAVKAFRFIALCKARGEGFARNGRTIRVGHYQVDRIEADGSFVAGCHRFAWPELERLAKAEGVRIGFVGEAEAAAAEAAAVESSH